MKERYNKKIKKLFRMDWMPEQKIQRGVESLQFLEGTWWRKASEPIALMGL